MQILSSGDFYMKQPNYKHKTLIVEDFTKIVIEKVGLALTGEQQRGFMIDSTSWRSLSIGRRCLMPCSPENVSSACVLCL